MDSEFTTETGCTVTVVEEPDGSGNALLVLRMQQDGDGRRAELRLSSTERRWLQLMLAETR